MKDLIIAIDGFSGCGKSSTAKQVAKILNYSYIDTGAMYRAVTLYVQRLNLNPKNLYFNKIKNDIIIDFRYNSKNGSNDIYLNNENVENYIRSINVSNMVSIVSQNVDVRKALVQYQREIGINKRIVMDGRDIGTNVFPDADLKIFMTADVNIRAYRRLLELQDKGINATYNEIYDNLTKRDYDDVNRIESPLIKASNAYVIDTSNIDFNQQVDAVINLCKQICSV